MEQKSWKPEVKVVGESGWHQNNLAFASEGEAAKSAKDLAGRWMLVTDWRAAPSDQEPNYRYDELTNSLVTIQKEN